MARLITTGFEIDLTNNGPDRIGATGTVSRDTGIFRSGIASLKCDSGAGNAAAAVNLGSEAAAQIYTASQTSFTRFYLYLNDIPSSACRVADLANTAQGGASGVSIRLTTGGKLQLFNNVSGTQIGSDSDATLQAGIWYRIEINLITNATPQITTVELRLDGATITSATGQTITASTQLWIGWCTAPGANKVCYVDDAALNDSTGSINTSWCGDGEIVLLSPVSDNARVGWTNAAGGTTNLFSDVDNIPPVGVASPSTQPAQIKRSAANTTDTYDANMTDYVTAGIKPRDILNVIKIMFNIGYSFSASSSQGLQMLSNPVISEFTVSTDGSAAGTYPSHWTWGYKTTDYAGRLDANVTPTTSPVMRVRKNTSSNSRIQFCDAMFAYVDYTPQDIPSILTPLFIP